MNTPYIFQLKFIVVLCLEVYFSLHFMVQIYNVFKIADDITPERAHLMLYERMVWYTYTYLFDVLITSSIPICEQHEKCRIYFDEIIFHSQIGV